MGAKFGCGFFKDQHATWMKARVAVIKQWIALGNCQAVRPYLSVI